MDSRVRVRVRVNPNPNPKPAVGALATIWIQERLVAKVKVVNALVFQIVLYGTDPGQ